MTNSIGNEQRLLLARWDRLDVDIDCSLQYLLDIAHRLALNENGFMLNLRLKCVLQTICDGQGQQRVHTAVSQQCDVAEVIQRHIRLFRNHTDHNRKVNCL